MTRSHQEELDKEAPLRKDVKCLGQIVGQMLQEQEGIAFFQEVEKIRTLSREARQGDRQAEIVLQQHLNDLSPGSSQKLVQAFGCYFGVVNLAERIHRIRRRRSYDDTPHLPQSGSLEDVFQKLKAEGVSFEDLQAELKQMQIIPVFTAHPTEAISPAQLRKEQKMSALLLHQLSIISSPREDKKRGERLLQEISLAWQTGDLNDAPTIEDEVEHVSFYLSHVLYDLIPALYEGIDEAAVRVYGQKLIGDDERSLVRFATWVGGDMDGHPLVNHQTIEQTLQRQRQLICLKYLEEINQLKLDFTQHVSCIQVDNKLRDRLHLYENLFNTVYLEQSNERDQLFYQQFLKISQNKRPYQALLKIIGFRLQHSSNTKDQHPACYQNIEEVLVDVQCIADSLKNHAGQHAGLFKIKRFIRRLKTMGLHMATLDVRQDSLVHAQTLAACLADPLWLSKTAAQKNDLLISWPAAEKLQVLASQTASLPKEAQTMLDVMHCIAAMKKIYGDHAIGLYIISMAHQAADVWTVLLLWKLAHQQSLQEPVPLDIAPLFETVPDLQAAEQTLTDMLSHPLYRQHLSDRHNTQFIMLGYSDSSKGSGLASSRFALYEAQIALNRIASQHGIRLIFFHGRGGSASRGGSKPRQAILAEPYGIMKGYLRLTEQGEIIHAKYGLKDIALRTMELMSGAMLQAHFSPIGQKDVPQKWLLAMAKIAEISRHCFRALVYEDPRFFGYFQQATPIDVISRLRIGSRPPSRRTQKGIEDLRAIPWVFSWMQNRQMLTGWYGMGSALKAVINDKHFGLETLKAMAKQWPFFQTMLADIEMVLAKSDMQIGERYIALTEGSVQAIWLDIKKEFDLTVLTVCQSQGVDSLLEKDPFLALSIQRRNPYVDPMNLLQIDLLKRWRQSNRQDEALENALFVTVKGIARGLQNTG